MNDQADHVQSHTELDSHANMPVVGSNCHVIGYTGQHVDVSPFTPDYESLRNIPVVDAAVMYECPYTGKEALIVIRNALHVPSMVNNLIPPFIIREGGVTLNETPKIHKKNPTIDDHSIIFPADKFRITLQLSGIFSYFPTSKPSEKQIEECEDVYLLTPLYRWDPHSVAYSHNEDAMVDWEGNIKNERDRDVILIHEIPEDDDIHASSFHVSAEENRVIDQLHAVVDTVAPIQVSSAEILPIYNHDRLADALQDLTLTSNIKMSIGSTTVGGTYLIECTEDNTTERLDDECQVMMNLEENDDAIESFMSLAAHARQRRNITPEYLSKVWRIDIPTAKRTLAVTSQRSIRPNDSKLA